MSKLVVALRSGLSVLQSAAIAGVCRTTAYAVASELGIAKPRRIPEELKRRAVELVDRGELSLAGIARELGISKTAVIKSRDRMAALERGSRQTRAAYVCAGCGHRVRLRPCVICAARGVSCQPAAS